MTEAELQFVVHDGPVWRDRANFIVNAELRAADSPKRFEQLWAKQLGDAEFEICCVPFFLYDLALGDVVTTAPKGDRRYVVHQVIRPSGRYVFRVWFGESFHPRETVAEELVALGALVEWSSVNLLAVDAENGAQAQAVADYLDVREKRGELMFETGRSA
jgi:hypothetical protein